MSIMSTGNKVAVAAAVAVLAACLGSSAAGSNAGSKIPDGTYRANITEASLRAAGVPARVAAANSGIQLLIFKDARWTNRTLNRFRPPDCSGDLSYSGSRVTLTADPGPQCGPAAGKRLFSGRWSYAQGQLRFTGIRPADAFSRAAWGGAPWRKIG